MHPPPALTTGVCQLLRQRRMPRRLIDNHYKMAPAGARCLLLLLHAYRLIPRRTYPRLTRRFEVGNAIRQDQKLSLADDPFAEKHLQSTIH